LNQFVKNLSYLFVAFCAIGFAPVASADTNIALNTNGGTAIFGLNYGTPGVLGTPYDHAGGTGNLNDGIPNGGGGDDSYPGGPSGTTGYVGAIFNLGGSQVNSLIFYGRNFSDGGWFGTAGTGPLGGGSTLTSANLIVPTLQYTTDGGATWTNDALVANNYVAAFTGAPAGGGAPTNPAIFTLTTPLTNIDGIRLIGEMGGTAGFAPGGFLGADEIEVNASVPEPSTYAMLFAGLGILALMARRRSSSLR
jgi:hypothetical protein